MGTKYFNNAGAGIMSKTTFDIIVEHLKLEMMVGGYKAAILKNDSVQEFYSLAAKMLNAKSKEEIAFIDNASRGWNLVMYGINITPNDVIVTLDSEYGTNLLTIYDIAKKTGCGVKRVRCNEDGSLDISLIEDALKNGGTIVAISHVTAQGAILNPVVEIGKIAKKYNALYIVDGCQAVGQLKVDLQEIDCHAYMTAGRKWLRGPRGTGILYVRKGSPIRTPQIDLASAELVIDNKGDVTDVIIRNDAKQFELWEKNIASVLGLTNAIKEYMDYGQERANHVISSNADKIRAAIESNPKLINVGKSESRLGIASFYTSNPLDEGNVKEIMEKNSITISTMCDWDCPIFFPKNGVQYIFRLSPHYYTSANDIEDVCKIIASI